IRAFPEAPSGAFSRGVCRRSRSNATAARGSRRAGSRYPGPARSLKPLIGAAAWEARRTLTERSPVPLHYGSRTFVPMATAATKVGPKLQVTIPKNVREAVGLKVGDLVEASVGRDGIGFARRFSSTSQ